MSSKSDAEQKMMKQTVETEFEGHPPIPQQPRNNADGALAIKYALPEGCVRV